MKAEPNREFIVDVNELRRIIGAAVEAADTAELPEVVGVLEGAKVAAQTRLFTAAAVAVSPAAPPAPAATDINVPPEWITPQEAAALAKVNVKRIYGWARGQRWASRPSKHLTRIEVHGFRRWLARQQ